MRLHHRTFSFWISRNISPEANFISLRYDHQNSPASSFLMNCFSVAAWQNNLMGKVTVTTWLWDRPTDTSGKSQTLKTLSHWSAPPTVPLPKTLRPQWGHENPQQTNTRFTTIRSWTGALHANFSPHLWSSCQWQAWPGFLNIISNPWINRKTSFEDLRSNSCGILIVIFDDPTFWQ